MESILELTATFPIVNSSRSLKVPLLLVELAVFIELSVAATGRRTGRSTIPDSANMPNTITDSREGKNEFSSAFKVNHMITYSCRRNLLKAPQHMVQEIQWKHDKFKL